MRVLVLFAHAAFQTSRVHRVLVERVRGIAGVTFHDLYEAYPDFDVDVPAEQDRLLAHDVLVLQHPFYWYSVPPLMKQWIDLVLEHGWAYGSQGTALRGKRVLSIVTAGGGEAAYRPEGRNRHTVRALLAPVEQTMLLCGMSYLPPLVVFGTHRMTEDDIAAAADDCADVLTGLVDGSLLKLDLQGATHLNELLPALRNA